MDNYLKTGFWYSLTLSGVYLPLIFGLADANGSSLFLMISWFYLSGTVIIGLVGLLLFTVLNHAYIWTVRNKLKLRTYNSYLIPINVFMLIPVGNIASRFFRIEMNVVAFSVFLYIPLAIFIYYTRRIHIESQETLT